MAQGHGIPRILMHPSHSGQRDIPWRKAVASPFGKVEVEVPGG
jgi:hypothetical protein